MVVLLGTLAITPLRAEDATPEEVVPADEILLTNGSRIIGTVTGARDGVVQVDTDFAGALEIPMDKIASLQTVEPVVMALADDSVIEAQALSVSEETLTVTDVSGAEQPMAVDQLLIVNPEPWEIGQGYNWSGLVSFAFAIQRGNTDTDELDYKLDTSWRSDDDRYILKMDGEIDEANGVKNADNWTIQGKYDNFFSDHSYWGLQALAEQDEFADLDLRYLVGPYIGREFYTDPLFALSAEVGLSYVNEDFATAEDQDYTGANWAFHISSDYLGGDSRLYIDQRGVWNLDETSDVIVNTAFGLGFPLLFGLEAAAEILLEYDSGAVEGVEELDETYNLRIGYSW
jgi:putative salt-induced outer membrane protein YdiY